MRRNIETSTGRGQLGVTQSDSRREIPRDLSEREEKLLSSCTAWTKSVAVRLLLSKYAYIDDQCREFAGPDTTVLLSRSLSELILPERAARTRSKWKFLRRTWTRPSLSLVSEGKV